MTGCDSITTLNLLVNPTQNLNLTQTICQQSLPFTWNGQTINAVGTFTRTHTTPSLVTGCDSITNLNLTVNPSININLTQTICQQSLPFIWNGQTINAVGIFTRTYTSPSLVTGCDSVTTLNLTVNPTKSATVTSVICQNNLPYTWNGQTINSVGVFSRSHTTPSLITGCDSITTLNLTVNAAPVVNLGSDITSCELPGWSKTLNGSSIGGTAYLWNNNAITPTISVNTNGTYSIEVTNALGCIGYDTIMVATRLIPHLELGDDTNICERDTIILNGTIGTASSYVWSTTATTATIKAYQSNMYKLAVTDVNGCIAQDSIQVTVRSYPIVDLGNDINKCVKVGDLEFLNARNPGADYLWDNQYNGQVRVVDRSGVYSVAVTNEWLCKTVDTINIVFKPKPLVDLGNDTNVCQGASINLDAGNGGISYYWNTGATVSQITVNRAGNYQVSVIGNNGCVTKDSIEVTQNGNSPEHDGIWVRNRGSKTFKFSLLNPAYIGSYVWDFGDGSPVSYEAESLHTFPAVGNYIVRLSLLNHCGGVYDTTTVHVISATDIHNITTQQNIKVYPNPTQDIVYIATLTTGSISKISLYNTLGQKLEEQTYKYATYCSLSLKHLAAGTYYLHIVNEQRQLEIHKVIVNKW